MSYLHRGAESSCRTYTSAVHAMHYLLLVVSWEHRAKNKAMVRFRSIRLVTEKVLQSIASVGIFNIQISKS